MSLFSLCRDAAVGKEHYQTNNCLKLHRHNCHLIFDFIPLLYDRSPPLFVMQEQPNKEELFVPSMDDCTLLFNMFQLLTQVLKALIHLIWYSDGKLSSFVNVLLPFIKRVNHTKMIIPACFIDGDHEPSTCACQMILSIFLWYLLMDIVNFLSVYLCESVHVW